LTYLVLYIGYTKLSTSVSGGDDQYSVTLVSQAHSVDETHPHRWSGCSLASVVCGCPRTPILSFRAFHLQQWCVSQWSVTTASRGRRHTGRVMCYWSSWNARSNSLSTPVLV